jgi:hypothetical protein
MWRLALASLLAVLVPPPARADRPCIFTLPRGICVKTTTGHHGSDELRVCRRGCLPPAFMSADDELLGQRQLDDDHVELRLRAEGEKRARTITVDLRALDADLLENEAYAHLGHERWADGLRVAEAGLALRPGDERLGFERAAALFGLGRADEARAAWAPLAARAPLRAYAAAASFSVLRRTLDLDELKAQRVTPPGSARLHASARFATEGAPIAVGPDGQVAVVEMDCLSREDTWLRIGDLKVPLGWSDPDAFHETGVTAANRLLLDRGFRFADDAAGGIACDDGVSMFAGGKLWLVGKTVRRRAPKAWTAESCREAHDDGGARPDRDYLLPSLHRVLRLHVSLRACGDGGTDPEHWSEEPVTGP